MRLSKIYILSFLAVSHCIESCLAFFLGFTRTTSFTLPSRHDDSSSVSSLQLKMVSPVAAGLVAQAIKSPAGIAIATGAVATLGVKAYLDRPSRTYGNGTVAKEYDEWTTDGILEYYWGEHIHLGYYSKEAMESGFVKKDFKQAKYDFIDEMMKFGGIDPVKDSNAKVLDVGCGFGGTSRYLAKKLGPSAEVTGITLSPMQVKRGSEMANEQGVANAKFMVKDALKMDFPDNSFDIVWACESGEHMPDKKKYIDEMMRVLKPGGKFVMATWCQRDDSVVPFTKKDKKDLQFLYEEWYVFGSICDYATCHFASTVYLRPSNTGSFFS
jgi:MPBQ/MSBQ methyltransferase